MSVQSAYCGTNSRGSNASELFFLLVQRQVEPYLSSSVGLVFSTFSNRSYLAEVCIHCDTKECAILISRFEKSFDESIIWTFIKVFSHGIIQSSNHIVEEGKNKNKINLTNIFCSSLMCIVLYTNANYWHCPEASRIF